jgi:hypothetical protein
MSNPRRRLLWATLTAAMWLGGCGPEPAGLSVSGEVTFQGKPLDQGTITFSPEDGQGTFSGGQIQDGRYLVPAENGLAPGKYTVRIMSIAGGGATTGGLEDEPASEPKERIPLRYNLETTLEAEVKESGENKFDYKIP